MPMVTRITPQNVEEGRLKINLHVYYEEIFTPDTIKTLDLISF